MTSPPDKQPLRAIAPFPSFPSREPQPDPPKRTKQSTACTACKARRSRCGGGRPCQKCVQLGTECTFGLDRRRRHAQQHAEQQLQIAQQALGDIAVAFDAGDQAQLTQLVLAVRDKERRPKTSEYQDQPEAPHEYSGASSRRASVSSASGSSVSVGSLDEVDTLTEDPNRSAESRAAGYIGKESEIAWMQKLETEASKLDRELPLVDKPVASLSYHVDSMHISDSFLAEPRQLPPKQWANQLVNVFFESVAPCFPLINKTLFIDQFNYAFTSEAAPQTKWLAVLNLIFAISSKYYQTENPIAGKDVDDHLFLSRAMTLNSSYHLAVEHADLHQVQIDLLLSIYYVACGQVNRSWQINGRVSRMAISLGLNLRVLSDQIDPVSKETRTRIWWSIFSLEHLLMSMTGRSPCVDYRSVSLYPPVPYNESEFQDPDLLELLGSTSLREQRLQWTLYADDSELQTRNQWFQGLGPTQSLYFFHLVDVILITHAAVTAVYSLTAVKDGGQTSIPYFQEKLQTWLSTLQPSLAFTDLDSSYQPKVSHGSREQTSLALVYYSSQIILSRPCLTRPDLQEGTNIRFPRSRFGNDTARTCVRSALALISVLPEKPNTKWILKTTPWFFILHFIMQALTVLLIQLSTGPVPFTTRTRTGEGEAGEGDISRAPGHPKQEQRQALDVEAVLNASKKALRWLHHMGQNDPSAHRAFKISNSFVQRIGKAKSLDLAGIPATADLPGEIPGGEPLGFDTSATYLWADPSLAGSRDGMNWGPDRTVSEHLAEVQALPITGDPALFLVDG